MLGWLRRKPAKARLLADRILEAMREIAVLLLAFAPLDVALTPSPIRRSAGTLLIFLGLGVFLFAATLVFEWRAGSDE
jgi:hypothetical protein